MGLKPLVVQWVDPATGPTPESQPLKSDPGVRFNEEASSRYTSDLTRGMAGSSSSYDSQMQLAQREYENRFAFAQQAREQSRVQAWDASAAINHVMGTLGSLPFAPQPPRVYAPYPKWQYHPEKQARIVTTEAEHRLLYASDSRWYAPPDPE